MADNVTDVFGSWLPALAAQQGQQGTTGAKQPRENSSADGLPSKRAKPTRRGGRGRGQPPPGADRERSDHAGVAMSAARGRIEPHQAGDIPHTAPSTTRARSRAQGTVHQEQQRGASTGPQSGPLWVAFGRNSGQDPLFSKDDAAVKAAQTNHVLDKDKRFVYQKWDAQASKLVTDPDKKGLTLEEVMAILTELRKLSNDQTITKFNASRRLKKEPDNDEKAVFTVEVAMRSPPANRIQGLLDQMTDNAAWGLVAAQLRPPSLKRRGLAIAIQKALEAD